MIVKVNFNTRFLDIIIVVLYYSRYRTDFQSKAKSPTGLLKYADDSLGNTYLTHKFFKNLFYYFILYSGLILAQYSPLTHGRQSSSSPNYFHAINDNNFGKFIFMNTIFPII